MNKSDNRIMLDDGNIELLKWIAVCLMVVDHLNKYLLNGNYPVMFSLGRLALPLFVFVLAYNLAREGVYERGGYLRAITRMLIAGVVATPVFVGLDGNLALKDGEQEWRWVGNILFTLALLTFCLYCFERAKSKNYWYWVGWVCFWVLGTFVEYWWAALGLGVAVWLYYKEGSSSPVLLVFSLFLLLVINQGNWWFMLAFPVIYGVSKMKVSIPRMKLFFYFFYPLHLMIIWGIKHYPLWSGQL